MATLTNKERRENIQKALAKTTYAPKGFGGATVKSGNTTTNLKGGQTVGSISNYNTSGGSSNTNSKITTPQNATTPTTQTITVTENGQRVQKQITSKELENERAKLINARNRQDSINQIIATARSTGAKVTQDQNRVSITKDGQTNIIDINKERVIDIEKYKGDVVQRVTISKGNAINPKRLGENTNLGARRLYEFDKNIKPKINIELKETKDQVKSMKDLENIQKRSPLLSSINPKDDKSRYIIKSTYTPQGSISESKYKEPLAQKQERQIQEFIDKEQGTFKGILTGTGYSLYRGAKGYALGYTAPFRPEFYTKEIPSLLALGSNIIQGKGAYEIGESIKQDPASIFEMIGYGEGAGKFKSQNIDPILENIKFATSKNVKGNRVFDLVIKTTGEKVKGFEFTSNKGTKFRAMVIGENAPNLKGVVNPQYRALTEIGYSMKPIKKPNAPIFEELFKSKTGSVRNPNKRRMSKGEMRKPSEYRYQKGKPKTDILTKNFNNVDFKISTQEVKLPTKVRYTQGTLEREIPIKQKVIVGTIANKDIFQYNTITAPKYRYKSTKPLQSKESNILVSQENTRFRSKTFKTTQVVNDPVIIKKMFQDRSIQTTTISTKGNPNFIRVKEFKINNQVKSKEINIGKTKQILNNYVKYDKIKNVLGVLSSNKEIRQNRADLLFIPKINPYKYNANPTPQISKLLIPETQLKRKTSKTLIKYISIIKSKHQQDLLKKQKEAQTSQMLEQKNNLEYQRRKELKKQEPTQNIITPRQVFAGDVDFKNTQQTGGFRKYQSNKLRSALSGRRFDSVQRVYGQGYDPVILGDIVSGEYLYPPRFDLASSTKREISSQTFQDKDIGFEPPKMELSFKLNMERKISSSYDFRNTQGLDIGTESAFLLGTKLNSDIDQTLAFDTNQNQKTAQDTAQDTAQKTRSRGINILQLENPQLLEQPTKGKEENFNINPDTNKNKKNIRDTIFIKPPKPIDTLNPEKPIKNIFFPSFDKSEYKKKQNKPIFITKVKSKGQFKNRFSTTNRIEAFNFGKRILNESASASFFVESKGVKQTFSSSILGYKFRTSKSDNNIIVEKNKFRIDTAGERKEITRLGILTSKSKKNNKNIWRL